MKKSTVSTICCQSKGDEMLKALSIRQPWATLVMQGAKTMEIRSWRPVTMVFPETLLIHAGQKPDSDAIRRFEFPRDLPGGVILGQVVMTGITPYENKNQWLEDIPIHLNRPETYQQGLYGFRFSQPRQYPKPIPFRGCLGFFKVPASTVRFPGYGYY